VRFTLTVSCTTTVVLMSGYGSRWVADAMLVSLARSGVLHSMLCATVATARELELLTAGCSTLPTLSCLCCQQCLSEPSNGAVLLY